MKKVYTTNMSNMPCFIYLKQTPSNSIKLKKKQQKQSPTHYSDNRVNNI